MQQRIGVQGRVRVVQTDAQGRIVAHSGWRRNTVTNGLLAALAAWSAGSANTGPTATLSATETLLGTGTGTPAVTDTGLFAPDAATLTPCASITAPSANTAQWISVYTAPAGSYTEIGLLTAEGALYAHLMEAVTITSGTQTTVTWQISFGAG